MQFYVDLDWWHFYLYWGGDAFSTHRKLFLITFMAMAKYSRLASSSWIFIRFHCSLNIVIHLQSIHPVLGGWMKQIWPCFSSNIIQILTATVMKYHVSVDCQESYIFPRGYIFPKRAALRENIITRENITILAPPTRDISSVPVNICYIRWSKWMISSKFDGVLWLSQSLVTRLGVCVQTMWTQTWQLCALSIMTFYC